MKGHTCGHHGCTCGYFSIIYIQRTTYGANNMVIITSYTWACLSIRSQRAVNTGSIRTSVP
jgi:hypothetical protein